MFGVTGASFLFDGRATAAAALVAGGIDRRKGCVWEGMGNGKKVSRVGGSQWWCWYADGLSENSVCPGINAV